MNDNKPDRTQLKNIAVLGSTGSIGQQTLEVIGEYPDRFRAALLIAGRRVGELIEQARRCRPDMAIIADESRYGELKEALEPLGIRTAAGQDAINDAMESPLFDTVVTATVGYSGLAPTLRAIGAGKDIALANKETLVVAGDLVTRRLAGSRSRVIPVDSEHSAIYQCLMGEKPEAVRRLIITASGGPFRCTPADRLAAVTVQDALHHPNWSMGAKITIDSASMINKSFEIIEARWLFGVQPEQITAVVHPQSVVHSMVEFIDGTVKAQLGMPDMRMPIRLALGDGHRLPTDLSPLRLENMMNLTFEEPDAERFPGVTLGHYALGRGGNTACVINAANEVAVAAFLRGDIRFTSIYPLIMQTVERATWVAAPQYDDYVASNSESRSITESLIASGAY
ncbi:MAG: 1-deoxy-D-xylulose-5-phosphate reductoisomerase [Muribaculaceae bacterium]|nr:1-deoxy-D-xylulose-5-phosphate reductoisomerase [Muribaculaceae bacterium]